MGGKKFDLIEAVLACPTSTSTLHIRLVADAVAVLDRAKVELMQSGLLEHYMAQISSQSDGGSICDCAGPDAADVWNLPPLAPGEKRKEKECEDERIDPEDGRSWTWEAYRSHYEDQYSLDELTEYWQTMRQNSKAALSNRAGA